VLQTCMHMPVDFDWRLQYFLLPLIGAGNVVGHRLRIRRLDVMISLGSKARTVTRILYMRGLT